MLHCTTNYRRNNQIYSRGPPPSLSTYPREWFSYADINQTGYKCQQNIVNTVCAHLRPLHHHQRSFLVTKINEKCNSCNFYSNQKISVDGFLHCRMDKLIIQVEQEYEKTFRSNHFHHTTGGHGHHKNIFHSIFHNPRSNAKKKESHGSENFVAPRTA